MIRGLRFQLHPRHRPAREGISGTALRRLEEEVRGLAELLQGSPIPVFLTGGVSFALLRGGYTRDHKDFDLMVRTTDILEFNKFLRAKGCYIAERILSCDVSPTYELFGIRAASRRQMLEGRKTLRIVPQQPWLSIYKSKNRLDYIDLFLMDETEESIYYPKHRFAITPEEFYPVTPVPVGELELLCPNVRHQASIKDCRDKAALREFVSSSELGLRSAE